MRSLFVRWGCGYASGVWTLCLSIVSAAPGDDVVAELQRAETAWTDREDAPYYVAITLTDETDVVLRATAGSLFVDAESERRWIDVDVRTGDFDLDSTHPLRGFSALEDDSRGLVAVPLTDGYALRHAIARELDVRVREAAERIVLIQANRTVKIEEEDPSPDFSARSPVVGSAAVPDVAFDAGAWKTLLRDLSQILDSATAVHSSAAGLEINRSLITFIDTDGSRVEHGRTSARVSLHAHTLAEDGDEIDVYRAFDAATPAGLPDPASLRVAAAEVRKELLDRQAAPRAEPYTGPVLLSGRAAAVFVHEVLGHRAESHRQKRDDEGKTFAELVGSLVLPATVDIVDDPLRRRWGDVDLNGWYQWDDEGTPAVAASLVEDGRFTGFLSTRSPIRGFPTSNGHARRSPGHAPLARMANTILSTTEGRTDTELRRLLLAEVRKQGLAWGYFVDEIDGGFTMTGRVTPNAFNVRASNVWRVWADGRKDERVRGIDLVGTPLTAFRNVVAVGDSPEIFNGVCGAESGWVPVSGVSPALLFTRLEFQLKEKGEERPPLLPRPAAPGGDT